MYTLDIEKFKTLHRANTSALVESLKGQNVDMEEFIEKYKALEGTGTRQSASTNSASSVPGSLGQNKTDVQGTAKVFQDSLKNMEILLTVAIQAPVFGCLN